MKKPLTPHQVAVGAKEVIELGQKEVESRLGLNEGEGMSWLFAGSVSDGAIGGGFLYTNKDSISIGVVCTLADLVKTNKTIPQLLNELKEHTILRPLLKGGKLVEYSGHLVPEAGLYMVPTLFNDGVVVGGDAAGLVINIGYMVRGMDLAIESGKLAAEVIIAAKEINDFSGKTLSDYKSKLEKSFVLKDLSQYRKFPHFLEETPRIFKGYPELLENMMADMFIIDGTPTAPLLKNMMGHLKKIGIMTLVKDGIKGVRAL